MTYIDRAITDKLMALSKRFPAIYLTGPRQSGKSTLLKRAFPEYEYLSLEEPDVREFALDDPRGFLGSGNRRMIIDEAQRAPQLFSYLQGRIDETDEAGMYLLSGSQNFLLMENISQSLAGRVGILNLLPLTYAESSTASGVGGTRSTGDWLISGGYPRSLVNGIAAEDFFPNYIETYLERDIRHETGVRDLPRFRSLLKACAARVAGRVNLADLGRDLGVDARTVRSWLAVLEESYVIFRLPAFYRNVGNRHTKTAKLYYYDTGLLCYLLGLHSVPDLQSNYLKGQVFENGVIIEAMKQHFNLGLRPNASYWRNPDVRDREVDLVLEHGPVLDIYEIKSSETANRRYTDSLSMFEGQIATECRKHVVYDGPDGIRLNGTEFRSWRSVDFVSRAKP